MEVGDEQLIKQKDHFLILDVLKFVSAVLIVFHHYQQDMSVRFPRLNFYSGNIYFGYLVELFFIISGFLIAYDAEKNKILENCRLKGFAEAWAHKAKRIYPMAILSCASYLILANIFHSLSGKWPDDGVGFSSPWCIICSFLLVFEGWPNNSMLGINEPAWYLCVLLACYLLFYAFLCLSKKSGFPGLFVYAVLFAGAVICKKYCGICPFLSGDSKRGYESFFLGAAMGCLLPHIDNKTCRNFGIALICGLLLYCSVAAYFGDVRELFANQRLLCMTAFYPGLILFSYGMKELRCEKLEYLGKLSFEIFLWHCPFFVLIKTICILLNKQISHSYRMMALITVFIISISVFMLEKVEKPINRKLSNLLKE